MDSADSAEKGKHLTHINQAIDVYSHSLGNRSEALAEYCQAQGLSLNEIKAKIDGIQHEVFERVWENTGNTGPLSSKEIELVTREVCRDASLGIDDAGIAGLMRWLVWMAWHEGCLKDE